MQTLIENSLKPELSTPFPDVPEIWTDPKTGIKVPKGTTANIEWRERLLRRTEHDIPLQNDLMAACKESLLFWVNAFCWTYHQFETDPDTGKQIPAVQSHWPFITWAIQDDLFIEFEKAFYGGYDFLVKKSREMGASWACLTFLHHLWLFRDGTEIREMSRNKNLVDGGADSLFWKHDYINTWMPVWMRPPGVLMRGVENRTSMRLYNPLTESTIAGESTSQVALSGGRAAIILLDEFAKVLTGGEIRSATTDVAPCRIVNSTTFGAGTAYSEWKNSGQIKVFPLMFWDHPQKGHGRKVIKDDKDEWFITSPWFELQKERRTKKEIAQEVLAEDLESGESFFDISNFQKHKILFAKPAKINLNVCFKTGIANDSIPTLIQRKNCDCVSYKRKMKGSLRIWTNLILDRPDQSKTYIFGIDVSKGQGASNSVVSIKCKETGEKIAEWADANTPPYDFARIVVALALWCGGANPKQLPFLKWEMNGPGWDLGRILVKDFKYPHYYVQKTIGQVTDAKTKKYGWHSSPQSKRDLLSRYNKAIAHGGYINHSEEALDEAMMYLEYGSGQIGPAKLVRESEAARKTHGDRVIADALTIDNETVIATSHSGPKIPHNSFGFRKNAAMKKYKALKSNKTWRKPFGLSR